MPRGRGQYRGRGWSCWVIGNATGPLAIFINRRREFAEHLTSVAVYDAASDRLAILNVAWDRVLQGAGVMQAVARLRPDLLSPALARWCYRARHASLGAGENVSVWGGTHGHFSLRRRRGVINGRAVHVVDPDMFRHSDPVDAAYDLAWKNLAAWQPTRRLAAQLAAGEDDDPGSSHLSPPDLVLVADLPMLAAGLTVAARFGCPLFYDAHEWWAEQERVWDADKVARQEAIAYLEKTLYPLCDHRVTCGGRLADALGAETGAPFERLYTAATLSRSPAGAVAPPPDDDARDAFWRAAGLPARARVALFVGNLTAERSLEDLMAASGHLAPGHFLIVIGDGLYASRMRTALAAAGRTGAVRFLGAMSFDRLAPYLRHAHLGVIPYQPKTAPRPAYFAMGMPSKLSDYYQARLPILVNAEMLECADIVTRQGVGFVWTGGGGDSLGSFLDACLGDTAGLARRRAAYTTAEDLFGLEALITGLRALSVPSLRRVGT